MKLSGNTILITGGATGIGLELAAALVARDNEVIICGRREDRLDAAKQREPKLHTRVADVRDSRALAGWVVEAFPSLNVLVNNAGLQHAFDFTSPDFSKASDEIAINLLAPIELSAMLLPHLSQQTNAAIINVTSGLAFAPIARMPIYCATKAALHSVTMSMRHQLRHTSVRVVEVIPPIVATELGVAHRPPQMNATAMTAETAARLTLEGLERDEYETALGEAAGLREKREALFPVMNR
jgi:uncharacterized oxidoreductase